MTPAASTAHILAVADILLELADDIELIGASLCQDARLVDLKIKELQGIDLIAQKQKSLVNLLRANCPTTALQEIGLDHLRERLVELTRGHEEISVK